MAYYNLELAASRGLSPLDPYVLTLIHQNKSSDTSQALQEVMKPETITRLYAFGLIEMIKGTKKMTELQKLRLTKKGTKWYRELQYVNTVENDHLLFNTLERVYTEEGKEIGSTKKTHEYIAWFRGETGFSHREIWLIAKKFVNDTERMEYSKMLEKVFWSSSNHFQTSPQLENSKLWLYYEKHQKWFDNEFKKLK